MTDPLQKTKEEYKDIVDRISSKESAVGIDAQYTHAIIIEYLKTITERLDRLEKEVQK